MSTPAATTTATPGQPAAPAMPVEEFRRLAARVEDEVARIIVGQEEILRGVLICLIAGGHALLEGVPGLGKTMLVRAIADALDLEFSRIQFTPDLMPADITGTNILAEGERGAREFRFQPGPLFANLVLADEINRATPKTQSALLEAMEERQVSIEGSSLPLPPVFITLATQNPVEYEGTYPLPEAQLDRFLVRVGITYMPPEQETDLLDRYRQGFRAQDLASAGLRSVTGQHGLEQCEAEMQQVTVERVIMDYITRISNASRRSPDLMLGASPRASVALLLATRAAAALDGRSYVTPDDVKDLASSVLAHRLVLRPEAQLEGLTQEDAVRRLLASVEVPR